MTKSLDDLQAAFAGESQANRRYLAFAKKAEQEGFPQVAHLFRAVAAAETVHALSHIRAMDGVKSTAENIKAAIGGENYEVFTMYPDFLKDAEADGDKRALGSFKRAWDVEKVHEELYNMALDGLQAGKDAPAVEYYVCPVCGFTHAGKPPETCPVCGTPGTRFDCIE
jgi:rubrerythrin